MPEEQWVWTIIVKNGLSVGDSGLYYDVLVCDSMEAVCSQMIALAEKNLQRYYQWFSLHHTLLEKLRDGKVEGSYPETLRTFAEYLLDNWHAEPGDEAYAEETFREYMERMRGHINDVLFWVDREVLVLERKVLTVADA